MPRKLMLLLGLGMSLLLGQPLSAQVTEENANPEHEKTKSQAETHYKQGNYPKAIELTSEVLKENDKDDVAYYLRGSAKVEEGLRRNNIDLVREGIADARQAISINGQEHIDYYLPYLYGMTNLSQLEGRPEHAEVAVQVAGQVLELSKINEDQKANVLYQRARTKSVLGKPAEAAKDHEEALKFNSMHMGAYLGAAHAYAAADQLDKAEQQFNQAISKFPNNPVVYNDRGMFRQQQKKFDEAITDFTRVTELDKNAYYAFTNRGFTLLEQGKPDAAESDFDRSLSIQPNQPMVHSFRGTARLAQGNLNEATADYRKVIELDPNNPVAKADLGFAMFFAEDYAGAAKQFEAATSANEELKHLHPWHLVALKRSQPQADVQQKFGALLENNSEQWDWADQLLAYLLGRVNGDQLLAGAGGENADVSKSQRCEAHFFIGQQMALGGNMQQAANHFQNAVDTGVSHLSAYRGSEMALKRMDVAGRPR